MTSFPREYWEFSQMTNIVILAKEELLLAESIQSLDILQTYSATPVIDALFPSTMGWKAMRLIARGLYWLAQRFCNVLVIIPLLSIAVPTKGETYQSSWERIATRKTVFQTPYRCVSHARTHNIGELASLNPIFERFLMYRCIDRMQSLPEMRLHPVHYNYNAHTNNRKSRMSVKDFSVRVWVRKRPRMKSAIQAVYHPQEKGYTRTVSSWPDRILSMVWITACLLFKSKRTMQLGAQEWFSMAAFGYNPIPRGSLSVLQIVKTLHWTIQKSFLIFKSMPLILSLFSISWGWSEFDLMIFPRQRFKITNWAISWNSCNLSSPKSSNAQSSNQREIAFKKR